MPEPPTGARDHWQRLESLFHQALSLSAPERAAFLDRAVEDDPALRREVMSLLHAHDGAAQAVEGAIDEALTWSGRAGLEAGQRLGAFRVEREIGRGGMGTVFAAARADDQYRQRVAIKLLRPEVASGIVLRRFHLERQILASLDHPNIARLLDGGLTGEGRPYLVMEYVEGRPISAYCDEHRLPLGARLRLFGSVCSAVHHAHRALVIHRDLKPANILVTRDGVPKLLDFGIAKVVEEDADSALTATGLMPLTPLYASPEQLRGDPLGTASDVYSLGVILYELLCGRRPFEAAGLSLPGFTRAVSEDEPERPSVAILRDRGSAAGHTAAERSHVRASRPERLRRDLAGDLDTITLKALRKEPERRYSSAEQMAEDILHYLNGRPVQARPDTLAYRTTKFVGRHRLAVALAALAAVGVATSTLAAVRQARVAERRFAEVRELARAFLFDFHDAVADLPGSTPVREMVARKGLEYLDRLAREAGGDRELLAEVAEGYNRIGDVQGRSFRNLGQRDQARASYQRALGIYAPLARDSPREPRYQRGLAATYARLGSLCNQASDSACAAEAYGRQLDANSAFLALDPGNADGRLGVAMALGNLGQALVFKGDVEAGLDRTRDSIRRLEELAAERPAALTQMKKEPKTYLAIAYTMLTENLVVAGREGLEAVEAADRCLRLRESELAASPESSDAKAQLAFVLQVLGETQRRAGLLDDALRSLDRGLALGTQLVASDPADEESRMVLWSTRTSMADVLVAKGRLAEAETHVRVPHDEMESRLQKGSPDARLQRAYAFTERALGTALAARAAAAPRRERLQREACAAFERCLTAFAAVAARGRLLHYEEMERDLAQRGAARCSAAQATR